MSMRMTQLEMTQLERQAKEGNKANEMADSVSM